MDCGFRRDNKWFRYRAAGIIIEDNMVLFAKNEISDYYYSVGGAVEVGESAEDAVVRELFEETGIKYEIDRLAFIHENFFTGDTETFGSELECHEICFYYLMKTRGTTELNSESYTIRGAREYMHWLPIDRLEEYRAYPTFFQTELKNIGDNVKQIITRE